MPALTHVCCAMPGQAVDSEKPEEDASGRLNCARMMTQRSLQNLHLSLPNVYDRALF
jgi:hypothetical protein